MAKYIDADAAIEQIRLTYCKDCNSYNGVRCRACEFDDAMSLIEDLPDADVVEVVRCKDCKYLTEGKIADDTELFCIHSFGMISPAPDRYCSYGERRE